MSEDQPNAPPVSSEDAGQSISSDEHSSSQPKMNSTSANTMRFSLDLSAMIFSQHEIPAVSDQVWSEISGPAEFITFSQLIDNIKNCDDPLYVLDAFDGEKQQISHVTSALSRHLEYLHRVLSVEQFLRLTMQMKLDIQSLFALLDQKQIIIFRCVILLIDTILKIIPENEKQQQILLAFSEYLIPEQLLKSRKERPYIMMLFMIPAKFTIDNNFYWLTLWRDYKTVRIYGFDQPERATKEITLDEYIPDIFGEQLAFYHVTQPGVPVMSFSLPTLSAGRAWVDTFENRNKDPIMAFLSSLPHVIDYTQNLPTDFKNQLLQIIAAPDLDFARAICTVAANEFRDGEHTKNACLSVLSLLNSIGCLTQFIRCGFAEAIIETTDTTNILRMSSIASMSSGLILTHCENGFASNYASIIKGDNGNLPEVIKHLMELESKFTPPMRFVLSAAFKSSRRKFPDYLVPLNAISSIFMLRYLATELTSISMELAKLCQSITLTLMFSTKVEQLPEEMYSQLALFLCNLTHLVNSPISLPETNIDNLLTFIKYKKDNNVYYRNIISKLSEILSKENHHPMVWSIVELFENLYTGTDENFQKEMEGKTFSPKYYVRNQSD